MTFITCDHNYNTLEYQVVVKEIFETPVLVPMHAPGIIETISHEDLAKRQTCLTAESNMDVYLGRFFYFIIVSFGKTDVNLSTHQKVGEVSSAQ